MNSFDLFEEEHVFPSQFFSDFRPTTPGHRLLLAILEGAMHDLFPTRSKVSHRAQRIQQEAQAWFASTEVFPCSFEFCCVHLGLEASRLRHHLLTNRGRTFYANGNQTRRSGYRKVCALSREHRSSGLSVIRRTQREIATLRDQVTTLFQRGNSLGHIALSIGISKALAAYHIKKHLERRGESYVNGSSNGRRGFPA
jgi:hypothetical protein